MNVTNWGFFGSLPKSNYPMSESPSAQWPAGSGVEYLYAAGLWIGAKVNTVPLVSTGYPETEMYPTMNALDIIYSSYEGDLGGSRFPAEGDDDFDGRADEDWLNGIDDDGDGAIDEDFAAVGKQMFSCWYTDDQSNATKLWPEHVPLNVHVRQESFQWGDEELNDFVGVRYHITNIGSKILSGVYVGIYADVDAGPVTYGSYHMDDQVGYWSGTHCARKGNGEYPVQFSIVYVYDGDGDGGMTPGYFGIALFGHNDDIMGARQAAVNYFRGLQPYENGGEPTNDFERYSLLAGSSGKSITDATADYRVLLSAGPFGVLLPEQTIYVDLAFVCGDGLEGMLDNAASAKLIYDGCYFDLDGDPNTGVLGRETPVPGPLKMWYPDPCASDSMFDFTKYEVCWTNLDCGRELYFFYYNGCYKGENVDFADYQTGIDGKEHQLNWITGSSPPPPNIRVVPGDGKVTIFWDNISETVPDAMTQEYDFEGYEIWRADDWHRPRGTSIKSGPSSDLWHLLDARDIANGVPLDRDFRSPYSDGGFQYQPLDHIKDADKYIQSFEEFLIYSPLSTVPCPPGLSSEDCDTIEALARHNLGYEGGKQYYKFVDDEVKNGMYYFYSVTSYDHVLRDGVPTSVGRRNAPSTNFVFLSPQSKTAATEDEGGGEVYVVPNPVTTESMEPWALGPNNSDPSGIKLEFRNLPGCRSTVRIYTVSGDLVQVLNHDGGNGNGSLAWNLLTRNGQDISSGVYLFNVEPEDGRFSSTTGKFVVIR